MPRACRATTRRESRLGAHVPKLAWLAGISSSWTMRPATVALARSCARAPATGSMSVATVPGSVANVCSPDNGAAPRPCSPGHPHSARCGAVRFPPNPRQGGTAVLEGATAHTTLPAMDMDRAARFYTDKVGAVPKESAPGGAFFTVGGSTFSIYPTPNPSRGGHTQMGLRVPDVRATVADLRSRGIVFEEYDFPGLKTVDGVAETGGVSAAWFKDTEDNTIGVVQVNF